MSSRGIVDLRKRKPGGDSGGLRPFAFPEPKKRSTLRGRRMRLRTLVALAVAALLAGVAYGLSLASYLPQFSIQNIDVRGTKELNPQLVRVYVESVLHDGAYSLFSRANIFLYPRAQLQEAVKEYFPRIENVHIARESLLSTVLVVALEEREAFARWCTSFDSSSTGEQSESCYVIDRGGLVFAPVGTTSTGLATPYLFRGGFSATSDFLGHTYLPGRFTGIVALLERLGQSGFATRSVFTEGEQDFSIALTRGFELRASFGADVPGLVRNLELVLSSESLRGKEGQLEYVDLRFGNRVYYKLKGEEQQSAQ